MCLHERWNLLWLSSTALAPVLRFVFCSLHLVTSLALLVPLGIYSIKHLSVLFVSPPLPLSSSSSTYRFSRWCCQDRKTDFYTEVIAEPQCNAGTLWMWMCNFPFFFLPPKAPSQTNVKVVLLYLHQPRHRPAVFSVYSAQWQTRPHILRWALTGHSNQTGSRSASQGEERRAVYCLQPLLNLWVLCCSDSESIQYPVHRHSVPRPSWNWSGAEEGAKEKEGQEEGSAGTTRLVFGWQVPTLFSSHFVCFFSFWLNATLDSRASLIATL